MKATPLPLEQVAYHEAGHAVLHLFLDTPVRRVSIRADGRSLGHVARRRSRWFAVPKTPAQEKRQRLQAEKEILALYAGRIAEAKYTAKRIRWGHETDYQMIARMVSSLISAEGDAQQAFLVYCSKRSESLVEQYWPYIEAVAEALVKQEQLTASQLHQVIAAIPDEVIRTHQVRLQKALENRERQVLRAVKEQTARRRG